MQRVGCSGRRSCTAPGNRSPRPRSATSLPPIGRPPAAFAERKKPMTVNISEVSPVPSLFSPISLGKIELANRIVMAPITRVRAGSSGIPGDLMVEYYRQRASVGMIITARRAGRRAGTGAAAALRRQADRQQRPLRGADHPRAGAPADRGRPRRRRGRGPGPHRQPRPGRALAGWPPGERAAAGTVLRAGRRGLHRLPLPRNGLRPTVTPVHAAAPLTHGQAPDRRHCARPFEPAVTPAITDSRTVGSVRALTVRRFLVSSLRWAPPSI